MFLITQGYGASGTPSLVLLQGYTPGAVSGVGGQVELAEVYNPGPQRVELCNPGPQRVEVYNPDGVEEVVP